MPLVSARPIIIVDDDPNILATLTNLFRAVLDVPVVEYTSPAEALEAIRRQRPALVITDLCMPQMPGSQLIRKARELYHDLPFVVITGFPTDARGQRITEVPGVHAVLEKPFALLDLLNTVRPLLAHPAAAAAA